MRQRAVVFRLELAAGEQPPDADANRGEDLRHILIAGWRCGVKDEAAWMRLAEDAVEHKRVDVDVELRPAAEAPDTLSTPDHEFVPGF